MFLVRAILLIMAITFALIFALRTPKADGGMFYMLLRWLLLLALCVEVFGLVSREFDVRNVWLYNSYAIVEFMILLIMVHGIFPKHGRALLVLGLTGAAGVTYSIATGGYTDYLIIEGLLTISLALSLVFLIVLLDIARRSSGSLHEQPLFWFFTGGLVYFGGIIPVLGSWKFLGQLDLELSQVTYWIVVLMAIIRYSLTAVACALFGAQWKGRSP